MLRVPAGPAIPVAELSRAHNETAHVVVTMRTVPGGGGTLEDSC